MQVMIHEISLVQSLTIDIPTKTVYLVRAVLRKDQFALVKRVITKIHTAYETLLGVVLAELDLRQLLYVPNPEVLVKLQFLFFDEPEEVEAGALIHVHVEELTTIILIKYLINGLVKNLLYHFKLILLPEDLLVNAPELELNLQHLVIFLLLLVKFAAITNEINQHFECLGIAINKDLAILHG